MVATVIPSEADVLMTREQAREILERHSRQVDRVVRCCDDGAVLFIGALGRPWTAWVRRYPEGGTTVQYEQGWSAQLGSSSRVSTIEKVPPTTTEEEFDQA